MYSGTRLVIERQLAPMQIGIKKTDKTINISARPSMPNAQAIPSVGPMRSTNCHCAAPAELSNLSHSKAPSARLLSVATSATQRAAAALINTHKPAAQSGSNNMSERIGNPLIAAQSR